MRLALLSNVTVEVLAGMLGKEHEVWTPPGFGAWRETALNPPEELVAFKPEAIFILLDSTHGSYDIEEARTLRQRLEDVFPSAAVIIPDLGDVADEVGDFTDEKMWKLGSMPWSLKGLRAIRDEVYRLIRAMQGERKKVLALDFDNTLWAGVIGEDGVSGISPYKDFQRSIRKLRERGVILIGLSKNNEEDVKPVWDDSRMVLERDDFADLRIDWNDKASNLAASVKLLNLGIDSVVFLDDNPAERVQMRAIHPEVTVPEFPTDSAELLKFIRRLARLYFPELRVTEEDRRKTALYQAEAARRDFAAGRSFGDYLKELRLWADVHPALPEEIQRIAQLSQKTNQFNVCTNRYTVDEVEGFVAVDNHLLLTVHSGDKFGDQGLVSFVHAVCENTSAEIIDWVMSCRVMNRELEFAVQEKLEDFLLERGVSILCASWRKTQKNAPVANLFKVLGFETVVEDDNLRRYRLALPRSGKPLNHSFTFREN